MKKVSALNNRTYNEKKKNRSTLSQWKMINTQLDKTREFEHLQSKTDISHRKQVIDKFSLKSTNKRF